VILKLLHKAAGAAEARSRQALERAEQLSNELHAAQNRIAELEAEAQQYRERANRAEEWLSKISAEIEDRLIKQPEEKRGRVSRR
jgi:predicted  nucleic acid-binding Zn-ribbon protein